MSSTSTRRSALELLDEISDALVGLGLITFIAFPFAVPIILLTLFVLLILAIPAIIVGLIGAVFAAPVLLVMRLRRRREDRSAPPASPTPDNRYVSSPAPRSVRSAA
jgi:hypothetical protein